MKTFSTERRGYNTAEVDQYVQELQTQLDKKEAKIKEAEGEAQSIIKIQEATAQGLRLIKDVGMDEAVLKLKSYEAMVDVANGHATKIIVPSELQNLATLGTTLHEMVDGPVEKPGPKPGPKPVPRPVEKPADKI